MKKNKILRICLAVGLLGVLLTAGTFALLKSRSEDIGNNFRLASVYRLVYDANAGSAAVTDMPENASAWDYRVSHDFTLSGDIPQRDGYVFVGWGEEAASTSPITSTTVTASQPSCERTVYAIWTKADGSVKLIYHRNQQCKNAADEVFYELTCTPGSKQTITPYEPFWNQVELADGVYGEDRYTLLGWSTDPDATAPTYHKNGGGSGYEGLLSYINVVDDGSGKLHLYAVWKKIEVDGPYVDYESYDMNYTSSYKLRVLNDWSFDQFYDFDGHTNNGGYYEKYNIPIRNLEAGKWYVLDFYENISCKNLKYLWNGDRGSYGVTVVSEPIYQSSRESQIGNVGYHEGYKTQYCWLQGENDYNGLHYTPTSAEDPNKIIFKATGETMYCVWDFSKPADAADFSIRISNLPVRELTDVNTAIAEALPYVGFVDASASGFSFAAGGGDSLYALGGLASRKVYADTDELETVFAGGGGYEKLSIPLCNLREGATYTLSYTLRREAIIGTSYDKNYGSGFVITESPILGTNLASQEAILNNPNATVLSDEFRNADKVHSFTQTVTFTATAETMYWNWSMASLNGYKRILFENVKLEEANGLRYDANDGTGIINSLTQFVQGGATEHFTVSSYVPAYDGNYKYEFLGWSSKQLSVGAAAADVEYTAGDGIDLSDALMLYAVWGRKLEVSCDLKAPFLETNGFVIGSASTKVNQIGALFADNDSYDITGLNHIEFDLILPDGTDLSLFENIDGTAELFVSSDGANGSNALRFDLQTVLDQVTATGRTHIVLPLDAATVTGTPELTKLLYLSVITKNNGWRIANCKLDKLKFTADSPVAGLVYDLNGDALVPASNRPEPQLVSAADSTGSFVIAPNKTPVRENAIYDFSFLGWSTDPAATVPEYVNGDTVVTDEVVTLFAVWEKTTVTAATAAAAATVFPNSFALGSSGLLTQYVKFSNALDIRGTSCLEFDLTVPAETDLSSLRNDKGTMILSLSSNGQLNLNYAINLDAADVLDQITRAGVNHIVLPLAGGTDSTGNAPNRAAINGIGFRWQNNLMNVTGCSVANVRFTAESSEAGLIYNGNASQLSDGITYAEQVPAADVNTGVTDFTVTDEVPVRVGGTYFYDFLGWSENPAAVAASYHGGDVIHTSEVRTLYAVWKRTRVETQLLTSPTAYPRSFQLGTTGSKAQNVGGAFLNAAKYDISGMESVEFDLTIPEGTDLSTLSADKGTMLFVLSSASSLTGQTLTFDAADVLLQLKGGGKNHIVLPLAAGTAQSSFNAGAVNYSGFSMNGNSFQLAGCSISDMVFKAESVNGIIYNGNGSAVNSLVSYATDVPVAELGSGTDYTVTSEKPLRGNTNYVYEFLGWSEDPAATEPTYLGGEAVTADELRILYAVWKYVKAVPELKSGSALSGSFTFGNTASSNVNVDTVFQAAVNVKYSDFVEFDLILPEGTDIDALHNDKGTVSFMLDSNGKTNASSCLIFDGKLVVQQLTQAGRNHVVLPISLGKQGSSEYGFTNTEAKGVYMRFNATSFAVPGVTMENLCFTAESSRNVLVYHGNGTVPIGTGLYAENIPAAEKSSSESIVVTSDVPNIKADGINHYRLLGWAESASATTPAYAAGDAVTVNGLKQLYAVWERDSVTAALTTAPNDLSAGFTLGTTGTSAAYPRARLAAAVNLTGMNYVEFDLTVPAGFDAASLSDGGGTALFALWSSVPTSASAYKTNRAVLSVSSFASQLEGSGTHHIKLSLDDFTKTGFTAGNVQTAGFACINNGVSYDGLMLSNLTFTR